MKDKKQFINEYGYWPPINKNVCEHCFGDEGVYMFIIENGKPGKCDYCGDISSETPSILSIDDIMKLIIESIKTEYDNKKSNIRMWDFEKNVWGDEYFINCEELIRKVDLNPRTNELVADISKALSFNGDQWSEKSSMNNSNEERDLINWIRFTIQIKHQVRYMFFKVKQIDIDSSESYPESYFRSEPFEILDVIGKYINDFNLKNLIEPFTTRKSIFRVRFNKEDPNTPYSTAKELGPPDVNNAKYSNRMSPAGIPMFYGALDEDTAIKETYDPDLKPQKATIGIFKPIRQFKVLDFSNMVYIPSLFDDKKRRSRAAAKFLNSFIEDIKKPIKKDGREHVEYVPTQVVTEYFRYIFKDVEGDHIKGIIYPSTRHPGGKSIVLFFKSENCIDENEFEKLKRKPELSNKWLMLISSSVKIKKPRIIWDNVILK